MDTYTLTTLYIISMEIFLILTLVKIIGQSKIENPAVAKAGTIFSIWLATVVLLIGGIKILPENIGSIPLFTIILIGVVASGFFFLILKDEFINMSQELLLLPQAFRMFFGAGFIVEAVYGIMPATYGVIDGILHITTAFLATTLAIWIARGCKCYKSLIMVNIFGLLDIVIVAYGISFFILSDIGGHHNVFYAVFFAAPVFIWLHLMSLYKLLLENKKKI
ncbi:MAG: hypothetical protein ABFS12_18330 [Bacteroidota bacterium]